MKKIYSLFLLLMTGAMAGMLAGCEDDDLVNNGEPMISYIRITAPESSDSLLVSAGQGQMIAIMGENLGDVREIYFNDLPAVLTPTFITDNSIITRIPSRIPSEITNLMTLIFANGRTLTYDFTVDISAPRIDYMKSEYVVEGGIAVIHGNYFYAPLVVTFPGGVTGEVVALEDEKIEVVVPEGVQPGPIAISTNFGVRESSFWFQDDRNIIASFDGPTSGLWHGPSYIVSEDDNIDPIAGKFIRMKRDLAAWGWFELYVGPANSDVALELKNIPADAFLNPDKYVVKFEINTLKALTGARIHIGIGPGMPADRDAFKFEWEPNIDTGGEWETVAIPWEDVWEANQKFAYDPNGYGISFHFSGPNPVAGDFGLDNMRVVPR